VRGKEAVLVKGYKGPDLMTVEYEDFLMPAEVMPVSRMPFKAQAIHLSRWDIEQRIASGVWDAAEAAKILAAPTQTESSQPRLTVNSDQKISPSASEDAQIFDIYECHLKYIHQDKVFDCILTLHPETKANPKSIFKFYPADIQEFLLIRFGGYGKRAYGLGLIEALQDYQADPHRLRDRVDWVAKSELLEWAAQEMSLDPGDPGLQSLDLAYHDIDSHEGLFWPLEEEGRIRRLTRPEEVTFAMSTPPGRGRAPIRAAILARFGEQIQEAGWERIVFSGGRAIDLPPCLEADEGEVARLVGRIAAMGNPKGLEPIVRALEEKGVRNGRS
jgi:hypothetical protein